MNAMEAAIVTVGALGALRWLVPVADEPEPWSLWDAGGAAGLGIAFALATALWFPSYFLTKAPLTASDWSQYCESVGAVQGGHAEAVNIQRSMYAAMLPGVLARGFGVLGGLMIAAIVSQAVLAAGLYTWARTVAGRCAGIAAVILAMGMTPLATLSRTVTFYPQDVAVMTLCGAGTALALTRRDTPGLLASGVGAGLALLWDPRGMYWALTAVAAGTVAALAAGASSRRVAGLFSVWAPVVVSWGIARTWTPPSASGLTRQTAAMIAGVLGHAPPDAGHDLVWGVSPLSELPGQLWRILAMNTALAAPRPEQADSWLTPWLGWLALACGVLLWSARPGATGIAVNGGRRRLVALAVSSAPFAATLLSATRSFGHVRYFALGFPTVAVVLGVGLTVALAGSTGRLLNRVPAIRVAGPTPGVAAVGLVCTLLVCGIVPNWLSPVATWREPLVADTYPAALLGDPPTATSEDAACLRLLHADVTASRTAWTYSTPGSRH